MVWLNLFDLSQEDLIYFTHARVRKSGYDSLHKKSSIIVNYEMNNLSCSLSDRVSESTYT